MSRGGKGRRLSSLLLVLVLLAGLALLCYPRVSDWWNTRTASRLITSYDEAVAGLSGEDYEAYLAAAGDYNTALAQIGSPAMLARPEQLEGYWEALDVTGTGLMGYITIDKIHVELPIGHGTDSGVLAAGAGHLQGSSLPVGGAGTHAVISAHRGLPSAKLFTNLDQLEPGDTFTVTVLDQVLTYRVDQITIVLPDEIENLYIQDGEDYCTLMTCTPYGINTHRLLVRGTRIGNPDDIRLRIPAEAYRVNALLVAAVLAVPLSVIAVLLVCIPGRRAHKDNQDNQ